ncbi:NAD(P)-binding protein [Macrolepiota fuliginosa MF-IS2]|uniref:NAD(P)-binding protein n=1 Tax=Macrolepiota fuliginosa MF-IS2 TaxID=1400762 RepID=A0A9P6C6N7_9AGAR|nr:NAD(P)-binding protein [Macrolepiota fuliginosa MF-IS2]
MSIFNATRLVGKTVLVTGASSGIGAATAVLFAKVVDKRRAGSNVILVARRLEILKQVAEQCVAAHKESGLAQGGKFTSIQLDVSDKAQVAGFWDKVPNDLRNIDILVNNAGYVLGIEHVGNIKDADIEGMFATNVLGLISMTQLLVREFKKKQAGHVINLGSIAGREPYAGGSIYTATKHAVAAFTGSLLRELVNTPIRVTEIDPGMVETEFSLVRFRGDADAAKKVYQGIQPLTGHDIAEEIVWAASRAPHINVAEILVYPVNQASAGINYRNPSK